MPLTIVPKEAVLATHVEMCSELVKRHAVLDFDKEEETSSFLSLMSMSPIYVEEHPHVCASWEAPHYYLMEILASVIIGQFSKKYGIHYNPGCQNTRPEFTAYARFLSQNKDYSHIGATDETSPAYSTAPRLNLPYDMTTIQQILQSPELLLKSENTTSIIGEEKILELCNNCINESLSSEGPNSPSGILKTAHQSHECIMYPTETSTSPLSMEITSSLTNDPLEQKYKARPTVALKAIHPIMHTLLHNAAADWMPKTPSPRIESESGVVIYWEQGSLLMPARVYATYIPQSARSITVMVNSLCATKVTKCYRASEELKLFLDELYTDADVSLKIVSSTASAFSRMVTAKLLLCPPGTLSCLLPALVKPRGTFAIVAETPDGDSTYHWFDGLGADRLNNMELVSLSEEDVRLAINYGGYDKEKNPNIDEIVNEGPTSDDWFRSSNVEISPTLTRAEFSKDGVINSDKLHCTQTRGRLGKWEKQFSYDNLITTGSKEMDGKSIEGSNGFTRFGDSLKGKKKEDRVQSFFNEGIRKLQEVQWNIDIEKSFGDKDEMYRAPSRLVETSKEKPKDFTEGEEKDLDYSWFDGQNNQCSLDMLNLDGLCELMTSMKMDSLYFIGDKVQEIMVRAFHNMLGLSGVVEADEEGIFRRDVLCPNHGNKKFELNFAFDERLGNHNEDTSQPTSAPSTSTVIRNNSPVRIPRPPRPEITSTSWRPGNNQGSGRGSGSGNCGSCAQWMRNYQQNPGNTFLVVSPGVDTYRGQYNQFCNDFNSFLNNVNTISRPNDVVYVRTVAPSSSCGCCGTRRRAKESEDIVMINQHMHQTLYEREWHRRNQYIEDGTTWGKVVPPAFMVDITPMTESHPSWGRKLSQSCQNGLQGNQYVPGAPPDWWNNMLYTQMVDVALQQNPNFRTFN